MSVLTLYNGGSLGIHVVDMGAEEEEEEEQALRSSWDGGYREYVEELVKEEDVAKVSRRQMALIYSLQLAEAYVMPRTHHDGTYLELTDFVMCAALSRPVYNHSCMCCCGIPSCVGASTRHTGPDRWRQSSPLDLLLDSSGEG